MKYEEMGLDEIVQRVLSFNCDRVIFTGGEPAMQDLSTIGKTLKEHGLTLSIESNGTLPIDPIIDFKSLARNLVLPSFQTTPKAVLFPKGTSTKVPITIFGS